MVLTKKYPVTLEERLALGSGEHRFSGSFEDFIQLLEICDYTIEYQEGTIIAMSIASDPHEQIVANFLYEIGRIFKGNANFKRYGSNRHVYLEKAKCAYSPDLSIVKGTPDIFQYSPGKTANKNPWLLVEILSESTRRKDLGEKLPRYKRCKSLQYIIFLEQDSCFVTVYTRIGKSFRWNSTDYDTLSQTFEVGGSTILLSDLYENVLS